MAGNREFMYRKLHSLLGVLPVGIFLLVHLTINNFATQGAESYNTASSFMASLPFRYVLEIFVIFLPLIFHAVYGLYIAFQARHNTATHGYFRNWMFRLQRLSGIITIIFLAWHVWETRIAALLGSHVDFNMMAGIVSNPYILAFYIVGITAAIFHFSNGLWAFFVTWGITITPRSQLISSYVTFGVFIAITFVGIRAILAFV